MSDLPSAQMPLNQHSLGAIELWLRNLGAVKSKTNPCLWSWTMTPWSAEIYLKQDELMVVWIERTSEGESKTSQFTFPYGLSRQDVEAALKDGP